MLNLLTSVAQWERETIGERTSAALQHKKAQGEHVGSPSLGFDMVDGKLVRNIDESGVLERVLQLRTESLTYQQIADTLTEEGHQTKRGGRWYPATVRNYVKKAGA
jgi:DNA invertase Pin-like site-specific DNA recombinase